MLVPEDEQIKRLNAARFQLDIMGVPGIIVARTDAEAANLLDGCGDERDQPFILGVTNPSVPSYKAGFLALMRRLNAAGVDEINGHLLYAMSDEEYDRGRRLARAGRAWPRSTRPRRAFYERRGHAPRRRSTPSPTRSSRSGRPRPASRPSAEAVADLIAFRADEDSRPGHDRRGVARVRRRARRGTRSARKARELGVDVVWDAELAKTPEGYYQIQGGIPYAIAKSLAAAPFADLLWMETKTADLADAKEFADAIHAVFPDKMLAYNLSPSFNWDTTGMSDDEMRNFPDRAREDGLRLQLHHLRRPPDRRPRGGGVHHRAARGRHARPGPAAAEVPAGRVALPHPADPGRRPAGRRRARWRRPGHTATTKAMGEGSTQCQHLVQTEVPPKLLTGWLDDVGRRTTASPGRCGCRCGPHTAGAELLELSVLGDDDEKLANVVFATIQDRRGRVRSCRCATRTRSTRRCAASG